eukprot:6185050-Pleurochrysis_carterae.AAC.1
MHLSAASEYFTRRLGLEAVVVLKHAAAARACRPTCASAAASAVHARQRRAAGRRVLWWAVRPMPAAAPHWLCGANRATHGMRIAQGYDNELFLLSLCALLAVAGCMKAWQI